MARPRLPERPRTIGPFFLVAILLSAGILIWQKQQNQRRLDTLPPPRVEHQVIDEPDSASVPPPDLVQAQAARLKLTPQQLAQVDRLATAYGAELKPLQEQLASASAAYAGYQKTKQTQKQVPLAEIQAQMSEISGISTRMVALRQSYWPRLAAILSPDQQKQARRLWQEALMRPVTKQGESRHE